MIDHWCRQWASGITEKFVVVGEVFFLIKYLYSRLITAEKLIIFLSAG